MRSAIVESPTSLCHWGTIRLPSGTSLVTSTNVFNPSDARMLNGKVRSVEIFSRASAAFVTPSAENRRLQRRCL